MEPPFFSVIIPTYNRGHFLPRAIDSVRSQTYGDWELWVVDDGSTDETREVLEPYCQQDGRIRYIQQSNQRVSAARNLGLAQTAGKYLCFLDSDDAYREDHLQTFADAIASGLANHLLYTKFMLVKGSDEQVFEPPDRGQSYAQQPMQGAYCLYFCRTRRRSRPFAYQPHCGARSFFSLRTTMPSAMTSVQGVRRG